MKLKKFFLGTILCLFLLSITAFADTTYIKDEAKVLNASTIEQVNINLGKLEKNTGAQVKIMVVKSLQGKNINEYAANVAKAETSTDKNAVFVVAVEDHKNKFLVGSGLNAVFDAKELDRIANLPNSYFKKNDFNTGILKIGQAIDEDITTKAVKSGKAVVVDDGLNKTVEAKKSYTGLIVFLIILVIAIIVIVYFLKKKSNERMERFARDNGLNYSPKDNSTFRSANISQENSSYSGNYNNNTRPSSGPSVVNNTTVINPNGGYGGGYGGNGFVEGMIIGEMLEHHQESHHYHDSHRYEERYEEKSNYSGADNDENKVSSGDWGTSAGNSDWGDSSGDSGSFDDSSSSGGSDW